MNNQMNYCLYRTKVITGKYPAGKEIEKELDELIETEDSRRYRVAVVGEFKRGKSSLINTLLGTEILPTDILPTTAVINRIIYDAEQSIQINYKDGTSEETTIERLKDYATKLDEEKEKLALSINDITVRYPSVLGQNKIEIIDTPGLDDDEFMTEKTFEVLDKIDTAIVVISATMPLSATEQHLIMDLIAQPKIYHLTFVITFIDRLDDEEDDVERIVETITDRIENNTYNMFKERYGENADLMKKAEDILKNPAVFAVSSRYAMNGIIKNDMKLLEKSRFPGFKKQLLSRLIGTQELDIRSNSERLLKMAVESLPSWKIAKLDAMNSAISDMEAQLVATNNCAPRRMELLKADIESVFEKMRQFGFYRGDGDVGAFVEKMGLIQIIVRKLSAIKRSEYNDDAVKNAMVEAVDEWNASAASVKEELQKVFEAAKADLLSNIAKRDEMCGYIDETLPAFEKAFPEIVFDSTDLVVNAGSLSGNVIEGIMKYMKRVCRDFCSAVETYISYDFFNALSLHEEKAVMAAKAYTDGLVDMIKANRMEISHFASDAEEHEKEISDLYLSIQADN